MRSHLSFLLRSRVKSSLFGLSLGVAWRLSWSHLDSTLRRALEQVGSLISPIRFSFAYCVLVLFYCLDLFASLPFFVSFWIFLCTSLGCRVSHRLAKVRLAGAHLTLQV